MSQYTEENYSTDEKKPNEGRIQSAQKRALEKGMEIGTLWLYEKSFSSAMVLLSRVTSNVWLLNFGIIIIAIFLGCIFSAIKNWIFS
jgi:hypothetical protein